MSPHRRHEPTRTQLAGRDDRDRLTYRATCMCGWVGEPVLPDQVMTAWDTHHDEIYGTPTQDPASQAG